MDIKEFILALFNDWVSLMSGIASVILSILGIVRRWEQVPRWVYFLVAAACFLFSSARVWTTEHRARIEVEKRLEEEKRDRPHPELSAEVVQTLWVDTQPGSVLFALVRVKNVGMLPSVAEGFHFRANAINIDQNPTLIPREIIVNTLQKKRVAEFHPDNDITTRIMTPIASGSTLVGWLYFVIPQADTEKMLSVKKEIQFSDVLGRTITVEVANPMDRGLSYFPGSGGNPFMVDRLPYKPKQQ